MIDTIFAGTVVSEWLYLSSEHVVSSSSAKVLLGGFGLFFFFYRSNLG